MPALAMPRLFQSQPRWLLHMSWHLCPMTGSDAIACCLLRQAYERQLDELTRAMAHGEESAADAAKERSALLQQLHGAEQVNMLQRWSLIGTFCKSK